jgi:hypothetical protein
LKLINHQKMRTLRFAANIHPKFGEMSPQAIDVLLLVFGAAGARIGAWRWNLTSQDKSLIGFKQVS